MINKKLVFHIFLYDDSVNYFNNVAYKMHMLCLKHYSHIFDKACFNISFENENREEQIIKFKKDIIECGFKNIEIIQSSISKISNELNLARLAHKKIEEIYIPSMNFEKLSNFSEQLIMEIEEKLRK